MAISRQEEKALFRFNIIFPLIDGTLEKGARSRIVREICGKEYTIPYSTKRTLCPATVWKWYRDYTSSGTIDSLSPKGRSDKGRHRSISDETMTELIRRYQASNGEIPMKSVVEKAVRDGVLTSADTLCMSGIYSIFKKERNGFQPSQQDRRAYRAPSINQLWQSDCLHGPTVLLGDGTRATAKMFVCIDDRSRLVCFAAWYRAETAACYMDCLWSAFRLRGLPLRLYYDNGSSFRDERVRYGCASLGVQVVYARPYRPQGKGVVERFNRTVRQQFLSMLPSETITLGELNARFEKWIDIYNRRPHSGLGDGMSPLQCYLGELKAVRPAPEDLPLHFRRSDTRLVASDRTIRFMSSQLEVPLGYAGRKIEIRYFDHDPAGTCEGFFEGRSLGMLKPVDKHANYLAHRNGGGK